jgi:dCMP deaminase
LAPIPEEAAQAKPRRKTETDRFYLSLALGERFKSDDPKARHVLQSGVGAVIVGKNGILAQSANVLPPALKSHHESENRSISDEERYHFIEHAERAAIFKALIEGINLHGSTLYGTRFPCSDCARAIIWAGIRRAVFAAGYAGEAHWLESQRAAVHILRKAGVVVRVLNLSSN